MHFPLAALVNWLSLHTTLAYGTLAFGMFFETLVGTSLFVIGEVFLFAGPMLAGAGVLNIWLVALALYTGAAVGDSTNYFLGRTFGTKLFKENRWVLNPANYEKGKAFFARHGTKAVFLARLIGPFNLVMPFLAGTYHVPYRTFIPYNFAGIFVGVGEFILIGYFFGGTFGALFPWVVARPITFTVAVVAIMTLSGWLIGKRITRQKARIDLSQV